MSLGPTKVEARSSLDIWTTKLKEIVVNEASNVIRGAHSP